MWRITAFLRLSPWCASRQMPGLKRLVLHHGWGAWCTIRQMPSWKRPVLHHGRGTWCKGRHKTGGMCPVLHHGWGTWCTSRQMPSLIRPVLHHGWEAWCKGRRMPSRMCPVLHHLLELRKRHCRLHRCCLGGTLKDSSNHVGQLVMTCFRTRQSSVFAHPSSSGGRGGWSTRAVF